MKSHPSSVEIKFNDVAKEALEHVIKSQKGSDSVALLCFSEKGVYPRSYITAVASRANTRGTYGRVFFGETFALKVSNEKWDVSIDHESLISRHIHTHWLTDPKCELQDHAILRGLGVKVYVRRKHKDAHEIYTIPPDQQGYCHGDPSVHIATALCMRDLGVGMHNIFSNLYKLKRRLGVAYEEDFAICMSCIFTLIMQNLNFIHSAGVVHCDVKLDNIMTGESYSNDWYEDLLFSVHTARVVKRLPADEVYAMVEKRFQHLTLVDYGIAQFVGDEIGTYESHITGDRVPYMFSGYATQLTQPMAGDSATSGETTELPSDVYVQAYAVVFKRVAIQIDWLALVVIGLRMLECTPGWKLLEARLRQSYDRHSSWHIDWFKCVEELVMSAKEERGTKMIASCLDFDALPSFQVLCDKVLALAEMTKCSYERELSDATSNALAKLQTAESFCQSGQGL